MGRSKALLTIPSGAATFVAHLAATLLEGGAADALVVGRADDRALLDELERLPGAVRFVPNPNADTGQLSSVLAGLNAADRPGTSAILVTPVDLPLVSAATVSTLLAAFRAGSFPIARVTHGGRHGHPVVFGRSVFDALRHADAATGAKSVVRSHPVLDVEVPDPGVLHDVDTPEDYARLNTGGQEVRRDL
jgi:molybdenum cofactor cytidylyltransferase